MNATLPQNVVRFNQAKPPLPKCRRCRRCHVADRVGDPEWRRWDWLPPHAERYYDVSATLCQDCARAESMAALADFCEDLAALTLATYSGHGTWRLSRPEAVCLLPVTHTTFHPDRYFHDN